MQQYADIYLLQSYSTCFGCHSTRNMYSDSAINKYLHTVASSWIFINIVFLSLTHPPGR